MSDEVKADLAEVIKQDLLSTLPSKQHSSALWTLDRMAGDYGSRLEALDFKA